MAKCLLLLAILICPVGWSTPCVPALVHAYFVDASSVDGTDTLPIRKPIFQRVLPNGDSLELSGEQRVKVLRGYATLIKTLASKELPSPIDPLHTFKALIETHIKIANQKYEVMCTGTWGLQRARRR